MLEDKVLVWRFNRGDTAAFCRIYEKYRDRLLKVAVALLNDRTAVEDVLHDVFADFAQRTGHTRLGPIVAVPVQVRRKDSVKVEEKTIVQFRNIAGVQSRVIYGPYGLPREIE